MSVCLPVWLAVCLAGLLAGCVYVSKEERMYGDHDGHDGTLVIMKAVKFRGVFLMLVRSNFSHLLWWNPEKSREIPFLSGSIHISVGEIQFLDGEFSHFSSPRNRR